MKAIQNITAILIVAGLNIGCGENPIAAPPEMKVQWVDERGQTWFAPPVTPAADDPVLVQHPGAGVVLIDRATKKKVVVRDPSAFLQKQQQGGGPARWIFIQQPSETTPTGG